MKSKVTIIREVYHVDAANKVVICELECDMQMAKHPAWAILHDEIWRKRFPKVSYSGIYKVKAKAKCSPDDSFNTELGKKIARSRAKYKALSIASRVWNLCYYYFNNIYTECFNSLMDTTTAAEMEYEYLRNLQSDDMFK